MNKKLFALIFAFLFILSAFVPAFADEIETAEEPVEEAGLFMETQAYDSPDAEAYPEEEFGEEAEMHLFQYDPEEYDGIPAEDGDIAKGIEEDGEVHILAYEDAELENAPLMATDEAPKKSIVSVKRIVAALVIGFLIGFIALKIVAAPLKSVKGQTNASQYAVPNSFELESSKETFLYRNVDKTPIPKADNQQK